jgi:GNAT superfamily N-acetyltransferase
MENMKDLILAIERIQSDHEDSRLTNDISLNVSDSYFMALNKKAKSSYSTKVVYAHETNRMNAQDLYDEAIRFFAEKPFGWFVNLDKDKNIIKLLEDNDWSVLDEYDGRYLVLNNIEDVETQNIVEVKANSDQVRDLVSVTTNIWNTVDIDQIELSIRMYNEYLNSEDRRGGYILYYMDEKAVGYGTYRFSKCRRYMYLAGTGVIEKYRKQGIYRNLLNYRLKLAKQNNIEYVLTQARKGHSSPILEKCSFRKAGEFAFLVPKEGNQI